MKEQILILQVHLPAYLFWDRHVLTSLSQMFFAGDLRKT